MDPDLPIIQRMQCGEETALSELMALHKKAIFRLAWRYTGNEQDAVEVTEETFVRAWFKADRFRPDGNVKSWLFAVAANQCRDLLRRRKRQLPGFSLDAPGPRQTSTTLSNSIPSEGENALEKVQSKEQIEKIQTAIETLPHRLKFPFIFCIIEENAQEECAEVLGVSRKTVEARIYRARQKLRLELEFGQ